MNDTVFTEVYDGYSQMILRYTIAQISNFHVAQEICQQAFLDYYIQMDAIDPNAVKSWLLVNTRNAAVDYLRKASTRRELYRPIEFIEKEGPNDVDVFMERKANIELVIEIFNELRKKNPKWYEVMKLVCLNDLSYEEAAKMIHSSAKIVKSRLYRARRFIRDKYYKH